MVGPKSTPAPGGPTTPQDPRRPAYCWTSINRSESRRSAGQPGRRLIPEEFVAKCLTRASVCFKEDTRHRNANTVIEALILIPVADNDGQRFPDAILIELRRRLVELAGGLTIEHEVSGIWIAPGGREFSEPMSPYVAALRSWWQLPAFIAIVEWAREVLGQESIFVKIATIPEIWPP